MTYYRIGAVRRRAKRQIAKLFTGDDVLDYGDIVEKTGLDLPLVVDLCRELEQEGIVGPWWVSEGGKS